MYKCNDNYSNVITKKYSYAQKFTAEKMSISC